MPRKLTYEYVYNYFKNNDCELLETEYINNRTKMKYRCSCGNISEINFNKFQQGGRCNKCGINKTKEKLIKYNFDSISTYLKNENYELLEYNENEKIIYYICDFGHKSNSNVYSFITNGRRCFFCKYEKYHSGEKCNKWNPNREEIPLNEEFRLSRNKKWIKKHMTHDINYNDWLLNPSDYHLDHIIPISIFTKFYINFNIDKIKLKKIINSVNNYQLLTKEENLKKFNKGNIFEAAQYLMLHGINF